MSKHLPLGSVVRLKDDPRKLVSIIGFCSTVKDKKYDYCGVLLPFGYIKNGVLLTFNHTQIAEVEFDGYQDKKTEVFLELLECFKAEPDKENAQ